MRQRQPGNDLVAVELESAGLEVEIHGAAHEQAVDRSPGLRTSAQQQVLEGPRLERGEPLIDASSVGLEHGAVFGQGCLERALDHIAKPMRSPRAIDFERLLADEAGKLAGRGAAQQIHLEESFLGMHEAERTGFVEPARRADRDDAESVAID